MIARIAPHALRGTLAAIPSKSEAHRALICAALADAPSTLVMNSSSEDIDTTIRCLSALGAQIRRENGCFQVQPIDRLPEKCEADCGESGSTLRFLLPVAGALGVDMRFHMRGRLPERPIAPLDRELLRGGCTLERPERDVLRIRGRLRSGIYVLPGDISSQYISGMLFALTLLNEPSVLNVTGKVQSADYIEMTLKILSAFKAAPRRTDEGFVILGRGRFVSPKRLQIGGDWSNAAFWLCADAIDGSAVQVTGLDPDSAQGDRRIVDELVRLRSDKAPIVIDAADIPDLIPTLAACACVRRQSLRVIRAERLRIKESDRLSAIARTLNALGGSVTETADGLVISGEHFLRGGETDACGDHRIAMMTAVASLGCTEEIILHGAEAVNKSYPDFWSDFAALGGQVKLEEEGQHELHL